MMTTDEFKLAKDIIWDPKYGSEVTTDIEISECLVKDLAEVGVNVIRIGRKPKSRNKYILFTLEVFKVKNMDLKFLTHEDAQNWQLAKNRGLNTLMKAPDEAFKEIETEKIEEMLWWSQAMSLAYRLGSSMTHSKAGILRKRGALAGEKFGV